MTTPGDDTKTLEQKRAAHALKKIKGMQNWDKQTDYRSYVNSLPANIVMNGLGQASAMLLAQSSGKGAGEDAHRRLYDHLSDWLLRDSKGAPYAGDKDLVEAIANKGEATYAHAQSEALAWLKWAKKFARAYLEIRD